jgi:hypothetical protein
VPRAEMERLWDRAKDDEKATVGAAR